MLDKSIQQNQSFSFQIQHEATGIDQPPLSNTKMMLPEYPV